MDRMRRASPQPAQDAQTSERAETGDNPGRLAHEVSHVVGRRWGDEALDSARGGRPEDYAAAFDWLNGQSVPALIAIFRRARQRGQLTLLIANIDSAPSNAGEGKKRLRAVMLGVRDEKTTTTATTMMEVRLLLDSIALVGPDRAAVEGLFAGARSTGSGIVAATRQGDFAAVYGMLNGMSMPGMLRAVESVGLALLRYLEANLAVATFVDRERLAVAMIAVERRLLGRVSAEDVALLRQRMDRMSLPPDQQSAVLGCLPAVSRTSVTEDISSNFAAATVSPLLVPLAAGKSFVILRRMSADEVAAAVVTLDESILRQLAAYSKVGEHDGDMEEIRRGIETAWHRAGHVGSPPWDTAIAADDWVGGLSPVDKLIEAACRSPKFMGAAVAGQWAQLLTRESMAMMGFFLGLTLLLQSNPFGWSVDVILGLTVASYLIGAGMTLMEADALVTELLAYVSVGAGATTEPELNASGRHLANFLTKLGFDLAQAFVLHMAAKAGTVPALKLSGWVRRFSAAQPQGFYVTPEGLVIPTGPEPPVLEARGQSGNNRGSAGSRSGGPAIGAPGRILYERRNVGGGWSIKSVVGDSKAVVRLGYERTVPNVEFLNTKEWHAAHSQGKRTATESARGILFAPEYVNQHLQNHGIEAYISRTYRLVAPGHEIMLSTDTYPHEGTNRLASIFYKVEIRNATTGETRTFFEAEISVPDLPENRSVPRLGKPSIDYGAGRVEELVRDGFLTDIPEGRRTKRPDPNIASAASSRSREQRDESQQ
jgi:Bacterial toxin 4